VLHHNGTDTGGIFVVSFICGEGIAKQPPLSIVGLELVNTVGAGKVVINHGGDGGSPLRYVMGVT
jgi:hypothetical protein